ncbi:putative E3 ubiquitin-protein ligase UBR7 [Latimeria chalumnae]|uniref:Putative E3 ubiquitin-protein ligase UBR7 n=1 Tax=Latimeria chalumnae TaxID=7897 RepID=H3BIK1_LATCH|nr:PREDICTED: putative E3 ubiquitin-protein ligase UBR7 [Latimeria chalumnae]XP_014341896.1 PREDICTED: putative E3 ubiquitin-protein ligase UBR7 [Latimeria chalumnae]|eukprot:XP_005986670.1 PREDICTED: putative E3 ubiquitin-protein ligase UBR7 [Latimeria chalumnae]
MAVNDGDAKGYLEERGSEEPVLSLVDVLEEDEELEEEACAVLGGSDSEKCSYSEGYIKRQALYACNTCTPKGGEPAGICLACSYKCHEGHELFELYTKRNFRCDCGNGKFKDFECKIFPEKERVNAVNKYNDNFFGLYCICKRPYPDPEDEVPDEMIQCVVCEDWFHGRHLGAVPAENTDFQEMVCQSCMGRCSFLWAYAAQLAVLAVTKVTPLSGGDLEAELKVKVADDRPQEGIKQENRKTPRNNKHEVKLEESQSQEQKEEATAKREEKTEQHNKPSTSSCADSKLEAVSNGETSNEAEKQHDVKNAKVQECKLQVLKSQGFLEKDSATYWPQGWRSKLCTCQKCKHLYSTLEVTFLLEESDTVLAYENKGKSSQEEEGERRDPLMTALSHMDRVQQVELIYEYNDLKTELKDYLKRFADEGKVVTREDIQQFFEELQAKKRRRLDGMQYYCS